MVSMSITADMPEYRPLERKPTPAYMAVTLPCDRETEILRFEERYGFKPEIVKEHLRNLMLGPVPEKEIDLGEGDA